MREEPLAELAELAADSGPWYEVPDADLVRLTAAARAAGHRWDAIADACGRWPGDDIPGVIRSTGSGLTSGRARCSAPRSVRSASSAAARRAAAPR